MQFLVSNAFEEIKQNCSASMITVFGTHSSNHEFDKLSHCFLTTKFEFLSRNT